MYGILELKKKIKDINGNISFITIGIYSKGKVIGFYEIETDSKLDYSIICKQ